MATTSSPFTKVVVQTMQRLFPEKLADSRFDNTGLLLEAPHRPHLKQSALLTVDLTKAVADEAIARKDSIVITYHPIIFRPLKALTLGNSQQSSLLRLAQEGISVYCPHTAVDAAPGGLNDWLADVVTGACENYQEHGVFQRSKGEQHEREVITPVIGVPGFEKAGYGRIVRFEEPQLLGVLLERIGAGLGDLNGLSVAVPQSVPAESKQHIPITSIGICAGSGGSVLNGLEVDMLFTGELSHHEALAAIEQDKVVVTAFHSNTERAYLKDRMVDMLLYHINDGQPSIGRFDVAVSEVDRDPFEIVIAGATKWFELDIELAGSNKTPNSA